MPPYASISPRSALACASLALTMGACAAPAGSAAIPPTGAAPPTAAVRPEYSETGTLQKLESDRDGDGTNDTFGYMDGARVLRVEVDENNDGRIDRWEYHAHTPGAAAGADGPSSASDTRAAGATPEKTIERIERATKRDGKVNRREFFQGGQLVRAEEDADADGRIDKWETYTAGALTLMAVDTSHRGAPDRRIVYSADGEFLRVEADRDGTGTFTPLPQ